MKRHSLGIMLFLALLLLPGGSQPQPDRLVIDAASAAELVYENSDLTPRDAGLSRTDHVVNDSSGFQARTYVNRQTNIVYVAFAGTQDKTDRKTWPAIALGYHSRSAAYQGQHQAAVAYLRDARRRHPPPARIVLTGHSLGGTLVQTVLGETPEFADLEGQTFNAPAPIIDDTARQRNPAITNHVLGCDFVGNFGYPVGQVITYPGCGEEYVPPHDMKRFREKIAAGLTGDELPLLLGALAGLLRTDSLTKAPPPILDDIDGAVPAPGGDAAALMQQMTGIAPVETRSEAIGLLVDRVLIHRMRERQAACQNPNAVPSRITAISTRTCMIAVSVGDTASRFLFGKMFRGMARLEDWAKTTGQPPAPEYCITQAGNLTVVSRYCGSGQGYRLTYRNGCAIGATAYFSDERQHALDQRKLTLRPGGQREMTFCNPAPQIIREETWREQ